MGRRSSADCALAKCNSWPERPRARRTACAPDRGGLCTYLAAVAFGSAAFDSSSYLAWHDALACDFFSRKQAMTLSMLTRDELHSLNTSGMHVAWSVAEGLNSAKAEVVEDAKRAKLTA